MFDRWTTLSVVAPVRWNKNKLLRAVTYTISCYRKRETRMNINCLPFYYESYTARLLLLLLYERRILKSRDTYFAPTSTFTRDFAFRLKYKSRYSTYTPVYANICKQKRDVNRVWHDTRFPFVFSAGRVHFTIPLVYHPLVLVWLFPILFVYIFKKKWSS